ncbi:spore germination protein GerPB [Fictibacillus aquaticus]|uniref:Spore gernimation protein KA n=1 Tax=Fictibacillus aquaticus TaxID=2021314 RepID=A0A235F727_9BACL|nr:spore germination protein GerPB [Fictibacillus aquaticus]OYD56495.1 spore gernimation protein KA [Fictibacillus aquaticus]
MNLFVSQNIVIHQLKVEGISNSSVLQVGSAGMITPVSNLYNSGGFLEKAPPIIPPTLVPLAPAT